MGLKVGLQLLQQTRKTIASFADDAVRLSTQSGDDITRTIATKTNDTVGIFCRKPTLINQAKLKGLRYTPETVEDTFIQTSKKAKSLRYKERQKADISLYGELKTERLGISEEELNELTPFRRLSKKPATLSDPEYFINQYQDVMKEYLQNWERFENLSQAEQIDRIVKYRYGRLVANKIMNKIQKCQ